MIEHPKYSSEGHRFDSRWEHSELLFVFFEFACVTKCGENIIFDNAICIPYDENGPCVLSNQLFEKNIVKTNNIYFLAVRPCISLHPGPLPAIEGSDVTLPTCHVTDHPKPVVTWSKSFGQLPHGRVQLNSSAIKLLVVRKNDSDNYLCTARNLLGSVVKRTVLVVVSLPQFTVKPPVKLVAFPGDTLTLNCSATGDPEPAISWTRQGAQLPVGRSQQINGALVIRDTREDDTENYICAARSARVFNVETVSYVDIKIPAKGKLRATDV